MKEIPSFESLEVNREDVIAAFKKFVERGITSPDSLDLEDPDVIEANKLLDSWGKQEETKALSGDLMANLSRTMIMVDAGFNDSDYLQDVLGWLDQDLENAEEENSETAEEIRKAMIRIKAILPKE